MNQSINTDSKNSKEPQQKYRLGTVSIKILGGLNRFYRRLTSPSASIMAQNIQLFGPRGGFLTHQWIITWNKSITDKYYDEAKMRTRQKCVATDTWRSLGCRTTPLEHWSRRKPTVEPRWAKQQTKKLRPKPTKINSFMSGPFRLIKPHQWPCNHPAMKARGNTAILRISNRQSNQRLISCPGTTDWFDITLTVLIWA